MKNAPGSQRHRQYIAPIKKRKRQTATQAIEPPALRRKGRTDEAHNIQAIWPGPSCAQPGRSRAGCRSTSLTRQGCARSHWAEQPSDQPLQVVATRLAALAPVTSSPDRSNKRTAPLDLHRPLEYAKRCHGKILPWDENDPLPLLIPSLNKPVTQKRCTVDLSVHDKILWRACEVAHERSKSAVHNGRFHDPRLYYPLLVRGSWMNDVNQSTLLTDQVRTADQKVRELIYGFWCAYRNELMKSLRRSPSQAPFYPSVRKIYKQIFINGTEHIDDFGSYDPLDHLDVIPGGSILEDYRKEFPNDTGNGRISKTILDTYFALFNKLNNSYGSNRFDWLSLTSLGRALHTIADLSLIHISEPTRPY